MKPLKFIFILLCIVAFQANRAQEGTPFHTNFTTNDESLNENYSICQDKEGVMIIANRKGILTFDAVEWKIIKTPELPLVVTPVPEKDTVFIGCRNSIGVLRKNELGEYQYSSIAGKEAGIVLQIILNKKYAFFLSQSVITRVNINDHKDVRFWKSKSQNPYLFMFELGDKLIVDVAGAGLNELSGNTLKPLKTNFPLSGREVFSVPYDKNAVLIGAIDNKLYLFDGNSVKPFQVEDQQYLSDGLINDGKLLDNSRLVISTSGAGCLVLDKKTGKTNFVFNYQTGLYDDEVLALGVDNNKGIWVAHNSGLTRIDAGIPVKNYTNFKGLEGNLQCSENFNGKMYVGTSGGIYFLDKKKDYVEYTVKEPQRTAALAVPETKPDEPVTKQAEPVKEEKKGFFSRLFGRKQKAAEEAKVEPDQTASASSAEPTLLSKIFGTKESKPDKNIVKKSYRIISVAYAYNKVPAFEHKTRQFVVFKNHLLASTIAGLYDITEAKATPIIQNTQINYIYQVASDNAIYLCTDNGLVKLKLDGNKWVQEKFSTTFDEPVYSFAKDVFDNYWLGGENKVFKLKLSRDGKIKESKTFKFNSDARERIIVRLSNKKPLFFLSSGIYSIFNDSVQLNYGLSKFISSSAKYIYSQQDYTWVQSNGSWVLLSANAEPDTSTLNYLNLFNNVNQIYTDNLSNLWVIDDNKELYKVDKNRIAEYTTDFSAFIKRFSGLSDKAFALNGVELERINNNLKIIVSAPYFIKPNSNQYQIFIKGISLDWGEWTVNPEFLVTLPSGNWEVKVRAKNIFGKLSEEKVLPFYIKRPFYATWWFYLLCFAALVYIVYLIIKFRERNLQREKEILEQKVRERTLQIEQQKEEIEIQRDKIAIQNQEITDSIRYAKRLQSAVMPDNDVISNMLSDYFVLFKPKDIVSGDFYWAKAKGDKIIFAAADCTGHGVPGGFLSMLGVSLLNEISALDKDFKANEVLNLLRARVKGTLIKEGHDQETKDGMDITLCIIDKDKKKVQFAGANNPLYLMRNGEIIQYDADKMPIGAYIMEKESFTNNEIEVVSGDILYLFSDGYRDQLGGPDGKRLKSPNFRKILAEIQDKPMKKQKELLDQKFEEWRGENEQVDDIMVVGIKL